METNYVTTKPNGVTVSPAPPKNAEMIMLETFRRCLLSMAKAIEVYLDVKYEWR